MAKLFANSGDPDQMPHSVASDLGLHCLPSTLFRDLTRVIQNCGSLLIISSSMTNWLTVVTKVFSNTLIFLLQKYE